MYIPINIGLEGAPSSIEGALYQQNLPFTLELSMVDTKVLAIFSLYMFKTAIIMVLASFFIDLVEYVLKGSSIYIFKSLNYG